MSYAAEHAKQLAAEKAQRKKYDDHVLGAVTNLGGGVGVKVRLGDIATLIENTMKLRPGAGYRIAGAATQRLKRAKLLEYVGGSGAGWKLPQGDKTKKAKRCGAAASFEKAIPRTEACQCGHSIEEHGHDDAHPGSTACTECDDGECIAYEAAE